MKTPDWPALYAVASAQEGYFTTVQAAEAGYSRPLLHHHVTVGRFLHVQRGVYRLVDFPSGDHEDLIVAWLWSEGSGVFSHETALALHGLSDALPARNHLTVPVSWRRRRLRVPRGVRLHFGNLSAEDRVWIGAVPVTSPARTVRDCAADQVAPDLVAQAVRDGIARGLFDSGVPGRLGEKQ